MRNLLKKLLQSAWLRPFNEPAIWHAIAKRINPDFRANGIGAHVVRVIQETPDCKTFVLETNRGRFGAKWPGTHQAGQHCVVSVLINGRNIHRSFSISSEPDAALQITIKANAQAGARFSASRWLLDNLKPGSALTLSAPEGDFVLDNQILNSPDAELSLIAAGSGITPIRAILRSLHQRNGERPGMHIRLVYLCRDPGEFIFRDEITALASAWPALTVHTHFSAQDGRIHAAKLFDYLGENLAQSIYLCGPSQLQRELFHALDQGGHHGPRHSEHFGTMAGVPSDGAPIELRIEQNEVKRSFTVSAGQSLLQALEQAGARVASGCRIGICNTCQCLKRSGTVQNLRTGEISDAPNELIRLCVSAPISSLALSL